MKSRIFYIIRLFILFILFFALQKLIFTWANAESGQAPLSFSILTQILMHGWGLDASTTGYLLILPFLTVWIGMWLPSLNPKAVLRPYFILIALLLSVIVVVDTSLYAFWKFKLDATIFNYMDAPKQAMASVSAFYIFCRILLILSYTAVLAWLCIRTTPRMFPRLKLDKKTPGQQLVWILVGGVIFLCIRGGVGRSTMNIGSAYFSENPFFNHAAVNPAFNLLYSWRKSENFAEKYNYLDEKDRALTYARLYPQSTEGSTVELLNTRRPHLLIIVMEGYGADYIEALGGHKDVSPNYARLIQEGVFFDQVYANSFRTDRGLVSALSGHISYPTTSIMKIPAKSQQLPGLARTLREAGYETDFLYGGDINFTNMKSYFTTTGYSRLTSDVDFSIQERTSSSWGAQDEYTFDRVFEMIKSRPSDKPWHIGFLTLSSHGPFEVPFHKLTDKRLNSFAYTDHCLGTFIDRLKTLPVWKDLLIVCLPDHGSSSQLRVTSPAFYHIPMLWLGGAVKGPQTIHTLMNQSDMPATLLGQMGLNHHDFKYSRNIFSPHYTYPFVYSTFSDGFMFKDSTGVTVVDNVTGKVVFQQPQTPDNEREKKGKAILQTSYDQLSEKSY